MTSPDSAQQAIMRVLELSDLVRPMAIRAAASLRLADHVAVGADTIEELAQATGASPRPLTSLVGLLIKEDILRSTVDDRLELTELGAALSSQHGPLAIILDTDGPLGRYDLSVLGLTDVVRTGDAAFETLYGQTYWQYVASSPQRCAALGAMQPSVPMLDADAVVTGIDWSTSTTVLDVGGGNGALLAAILNQHPYLSGAVLDLPGFQQNAAFALELTDPTRAAYIGGDFFREIPTGFDVYLLSAVLYDWDDARSIQILNNLATLPGRPRVLVSEISMQRTGEARDHRIDLQMYCGAAGFERTPDEIIRLATRAGLASVGHATHRGQRFVIEFKNPQP